MQFSYECLFCNALSMFINHSMHEVQARNDKVQLAKIPCYISQWSDDLIATKNRQKEEKHKADRQFGCQTLAQHSLHCIIYINVKRYILQGQKYSWILVRISRGGKSNNKMTHFCYPDKSWLNRIKRKLGLVLEAQLFDEFGKRKLSNE